MTKVLKAKKSKGSKKNNIKKALGSTLKAFGRTYKRKSCSKTKAAAVKSGISSKKSGKSVMVKKNPIGGYCTYIGSKRKKLKAK